MWLLTTDVSSKTTQQVFIEPLFQVPLQGPGNTGYRQSSCRLRSQTDTLFNVRRNNCDETNAQPEERGGGAAEVRGLLGEDNFMKSWQARGLQPGTHPEGEPSR